MVLAIKPYVDCSHLSKDLFLWAGGVGSKGWELARVICSLFFLLSLNGSSAQLLFVCGFVKSCWREWGERVFPFRSSEICTVCLARKGEVYKVGLQGRPEVTCSVFAFDCVSLFWEWWGKRQGCILGLWNRSLESLIKVGCPSQKRLKRIFCCRTLTWTPGILAFYGILAFLPKSLIKNKIQIFWFSSIFRLFPTFRLSDSTTLVYTV